MSTAHFQSREGATRSPHAGRPRKRIGRAGSWELLQPLGEGAMSRVYLARPIDARPTAPAAYAVKVLRRRWHAESRAIAVVRREAEVGAAADHPNVIPVLAATLDTAPQFTVMPYVSGVNGVELIELRGSVSIAEALWLTRQAVQGLAAIYDRCKMTHGDVCPANLIVSPSGHATLIDLGFARSEDECRSVADRPVMGNLRYAAPESITSSLVADLRSDFYSVGVMMYEFLTGAVPFDAVNAGELATMHRRERPVCIRKRVPRLPKAIAALVHELLSKDPLRRPQSHAELIGRLKRMEVSYFGLRS